MIYLPAKAPADIVDYNLDMTQFIPDGFSIDSLTVDVTAAGNSESPLALSVVSAAPQPLVDQGNNVAILLWLSGGTSGVRYRGTIHMSDSQSGDPDRLYERIFEVEVLPL